CRETSPSRITRAAREFTGGAVSFYSRKAPGGKRIFSMGRCAILRQRTPRRCASGDRRPSRRTRAEYARPRRERASNPPRSEEHTSELQSRQYLVCRLLLEKK